MNNNDSCPNCGSIKKYESKGFGNIHSHGYNKDGTMISSYNQQCGECKICWNKTFDYGSKKIILKWKNKIKEISMNKSFTLQNENPMFVEYCKRKGIDIKKMGKEIYKALNVKNEKREDGN